MPTKNRDNGEGYSDNNQYDIVAELKRALRALLSVLVALIALLAFFGVCAQSCLLFVVELLIGLGALTIGALLGFLFGIPGVADGTQRPTSAKDGGPSDYRPSNHLETVSDWLTKIIVGLGLAQFKDLLGGLNYAGKLVGASFPAIQTAGLVSQWIIVAFWVEGFLIGFLWTRVRYPKLMVTADRSLREEVLELKAEAKEAKEEREGIKKTARTILQQPDTDTWRETNPQEVRESLDPSGRGNDLIKEIEEFYRKEPIYQSDPGLDFERLRKNEKARKIAGRILSRQGQGLTLEVRVESDQELTGEVVYLLHPTLPHRMRSATVKNNSAAVQFYAEGYFHVVAIADKGQTVLLYDLRQVPDAPEWFKSQ